MGSTRERRRRRITNGSGPKGVKMSSIGEERRTRKREVKKGKGFEYLTHPEKYSIDVKAIRQTQSLNTMSLDELMGNLETIELEMQEDLRRKKQHVILVEKEKQCVKDSAGTGCAFPTFHSVDSDSDSDVDPKEMLIIVEEKFQESLRVNKKKSLENDSLKRELAESKRDVEQLIKELRRYKGKVIAEDDTEDDTEVDTEVDTAEELAILQRKWVELVQANQKTVLENHQLVDERNRLKESSESNKTPLDLFVDQRKEVAQKTPQRRKLEAAESAGTSSARPAEASHEASARTIYAAPYAKRQRVVTQSSMRRHKDHYAKPERVRDKFNAMPNQQLYTTKAWYKWLQGDKTKPEWRHWVWNSLTPPKFRFIGWLFWKKKIQMKERMARFLNLSAECELCGNATETQDHLFLECERVKPVFQNIMEMFNIKLRLGTGIEEEIQRFKGGGGRKIGLCWPFGVRMFTSNGNGGTR
ncbi:unnamed protein product [Cuscuta campestris]|uniref:Reverse transcriptase zinc-binding domain-containing protein n=1 Tax=Cuscuta campestris TaxID=132261 RepID=A0A484LT08_9ASTE|nr:unnamed protein product [Cuscuta campestris]